MPIELTGKIDLSALLKRLEKAQDTANQANLERYESLLASLETLGQQVGEQGTFGQAFDLISQVGEAARVRIAEQAKKATAAGEQDLISRGLGSTTIRQAERRGVAATAERATQEAEERTAAQKAGVLTQRAGAEMQVGALKAGAMERREDVGPDLGVFASLIQAAAAGETAEAKRTATVIGPQAQAGRTATGQPFQYAGAPTTGGGGGGLAPAGGGAGGGGGISGGAISGATGAARASGIDPQTGRYTGLEFAGVGEGGASTVFLGEGGAQGQVTTTPGAPTTPGEAVITPTEPTTQPATQPAGGGGLSMNDPEWWSQRGLPVPRSVREGLGYNPGGLKALGAATTVSGGAAAGAGGAGVGGGVGIGLAGAGIGGGAATSPYRQKKPTFIR